MVHARRAGFDTGAGITFQSIYGGKYYSFGVDTQITGKGIQVFTGLELSSNGSTKKDFLPPEQSRLFDHFNEFGGRGAIFYLQSSAMQMGNGQAVVNYTDTNNGNTYLTNNTFLQTNVSASHIEIGNFEHAPTSQAEALHNQAIGFDYSGTYTYDSGVNTNLSAPTQGVFSSPGLNYGNFIVMNPDPQNTGKAPNHLILTCPMFIHGVTQVDQNAILQLGDGTTGNSQARTLVIGTHSYAGTYSTSYGNGILLTAVNDTTTTLNTAFDEIIDNGAIIVDNTPGAADLQGDAAHARRNQHVQRRHHGG